VQVALAGGVILDLLEFGQPAGHPLAARLGDNGLGYIALRVNRLSELLVRIGEAGYTCYSDGPQQITLGPLAGGKVALVADADGVPVELIEAPAG
jgi:hypothetical protein